MTSELVFVVICGIAVGLAAIYVVDDEDRSELNLVSYVLLAAAPLLFILGLLGDSFFQALAFVVLGYAFAIFTARFLVTTLPDFAPAFMGVFAILFVAAIVYAISFSPDDPAFESVSEVAPAGQGAPALPSFNTRPVLGQTVPACSAGTATLRLAWLPLLGASQQWMDLSPAPTFAPGAFVGYGPMSPETTEYIWTGPVANQPRAWRVNALTSSGWVTSEVAQITPCS